VSRQRSRVALGLLVLAGSLSASSLAMAGPAAKVYRPVVEKGETEIELRSGYRDFADAPDVHASVIDFGYAFTNRWKSELVFEYEGETGEGGRPEALEWENLVVLTEQGKHWADVGLLLEYEHTFSDEPGEVKLSGLFEKEIGPAIADFNLGLARQVGSGASDQVELEYAWQVKRRGKEALEWGVQGIGALGPVNHLGDGDAHSVGPALFGVKRLASGNKLAYEAGVLAGVNDAAPDLTVRVSLELEIY
jgi:hypothetical protein